VVYYWWRRQIPSVIVVIGPRLIVVGQCPFTPAITISVIMRGDLNESNDVNGVEPIGKEEGLVQERNQINYTVSSPESNK